MNDLLSRFESINPFSTKPVESFVVEVMKELGDLRVTKIHTGVSNIIENVPYSESVTELVASIDFDNPTGLVTAVPESKPKMELSPESIEQKRANLEALYADSGTTQHQDTQAVLKG